jgi:hypothetical protein
VNSIRAIFVGALTAAVFCGAQPALAQVTPAPGALAQPAPQTNEAYEDHNQSPPRALDFSTIEGNIHDPGKIAYPNASVLLFTEQGHTLVASVKSDHNGRFEFGKIKPGLYRVVAKLGSLCAANIPVKVSSFVLGRHRLQITMQPGGLDTCSYGTAK